MSRAKLPGDGPPSMVAVFGLDETDDEDARSTDRVEEGQDSKPRKNMWGGDVGETVFGGKLRRPRLRYVGRPFGAGLETDQDDKPAQKPDENREEMDSATQDCPPRRRRR